MVGTPVYSLPDSASNEYAIRQQDYDAQVAEGVIDPRGGLEASAAQATTVRQNDQLLPKWEVLFGLQMKTTIAQFEPPPGYTAYRSISSMEAPSLGPRTKRRADMEKIEEASKSLSGDDLEAAKRLTSVIGQTVVDNKEIIWTRGQMGSVLPG